MERLSDRVGLLGLGNGLALVVQLLQGILLARLWSREALASYLQVTMLVATLSPVLFLGIPSSLYYFLALYRDDRRDRVLVQSLGLLAALGLAGAGAVVLLAGPLAAWLNNPALTPAVRLYGLALVGMLPAALGHPLLVSLHRYRAATGLAFGTSLVDAVIAVGAAAAGAPLTTLVAGLTAAHLLVGALVGGLVLRTVGAAGLAGAVRGGCTPLLEQLRYAVPFAVSMHVGTVNRFLDRYLIATFYAPALFAVYAVGAREVPVAPFVIASINIVLQQRFTTLHREGRAAEILPTWHAAVRRQALLVLPLAGVLLLLAEPFVTTLYSDRYRDSVPVFRVYLGLLALRVATWPIVLTAVGRTRTLLAGSVLALATNVAASAALIGPLGLVGPAVGTLAGALVSAAFYLLRTRALLRTSVGALVPWPTLLATAAAAAGAALPLVPFVPGLDAPLPALAGAAAYAAAFALLGRAVGVLRADDAGLILRWLRLEPLLGDRRGLRARRSRP